MKNFYITPYNMGSKSAKDLAALLGAKRINKDENRLDGRNTKTVLNWGNSEITHP